MLACSAGEPIIAIHFQGEAMLLRTTAERLATEPSRPAFLCSTCILAAASVDCL
jgi:hypothetical protein